MSVRSRIVMELFILLASLTVIYTPVGIIVAIISIISLFFNFKYIFAEQKGTEKTEIDNKERTNKEKIKETLNEQKEKNVILKEDTHKEVEKIIEEYDNNEKNFNILMDKYDLETRNLLIKEIQKYCRNKLTSTRDYKTTEKFNGLLTSIIKYK